MIPGKAGPGSMLTGYVLFGFAAVFIKLARQYDWLVSHALLARFGLALAGVVALSVFARAKGFSWGFEPKNRRLLFWRGLFGGAAMVCYFTAIQYLGAGKGTLLNYTHSVFANLFAFLFLRHRPPLLYWPCLVAALCGLWLVVNPGFDRFSWPEALGLFSGMLGGAAILTIKSLRVTDNAITIFSALTLGGLAFCLPVLYFEGGNQIWSLSEDRLQPVGWIALLVMGVLSMVGQLFFTHGYGGTSVALGTVMSMITPLLAALMGWWFLGELLSPGVLAGGALILASSVATGLIEKRKPV